jgi:hypothetical protein
MRELVDEARVLQYWGAVRGCTAGEAGQGFVCDRHGGELPITLSKAAVHN